MTAARTAPLDRRAVLSRCIGTDPQTFAREHWGRLPLLSRAGTLPRDFDDLLSAQAVDELLAERGVRAPFIRVAREGEVLAKDTYLGPAGFGAEMPDQVDSAKVLAQFGSGATIVLQGLHRCWPPLIDFVRDMVDDVGHPVQANAYVTPPGNRGFDPHYDVHDVFVLQTTGSKHWTVHEPAHADPLPSQPWTEHRAAIARRVRDEPFIDTILGPGDAMYLPRGWIHSARAQDALSIHLTIGVSSLTGLDVLSAVVEALADDGEYRKSLPLAIDATSRSDMAARTTKLIAELTETLRDRTQELAEDAATRLARRYADRTRPVAIRPLASLAAAEQAATAAVRWRRGLVATIERGAGRVAVRLSDRTISLPDSCADALTALQPRPGRRCGHPARPRPGRRGSGDPQAAARSRPGAGGRMTVSDWAPCSDRSRQRNDAMYGSASAGSAWLMLELCGPWGHSAFLDSPSVVEPILGRAIVRRAEKAGMRIAAIRRPGRRAANRRWRWFVAQSSVGDESLHHGEVTDPREYLEIALDGSDGHRVAEPLVAVCAHGKHDQCCAVRGRGAVASIAARYPEITWECSHLGGDRFAATMLVLPEGLCYGRVDEADPVELVRLYLDGRLDDAHLRGRTSLPHAVQAAQHFAREVSGDDRIDTLAPLRVETDGTLTHVLLQGDSGQLEVTVGAHWSEPLLSQCSARVPGRVRNYALVSIATTP